MPTIAASLITHATPCCASFLTWLWRCSWQAAVVVGVVLVVRRLCGRWLTAGCRYALWSLVLLRLVVSAGPGTAWSIFNLPNAFARSSPRPSVELFPGEPVPTPLSQRVNWAIHIEPLAPPAAAAAPQAPDRSLAASPLPFWLFVGWLATTVILFARLLHTNRAFWKRVERSTSATPWPARDLLDCCRREMHLRRAPQLIVTDAIRTPALAGLFRAKILLPPSFANGSPPGDLRLVLLHELAHFRGGDIALDWLWTALQFLHWFNPALWIVGLCARADRELARDAAVLKITGPFEADAYGSMLLRLVQGIHPARLQAGLIGALHVKSRLRERVRWIAGHSLGRNQFSWVGLPLLVALGCTTLSNSRRADAPNSPHPHSSDQAASRPAPSDPHALDTRIYDIRDLICAIPDFDAPPDLSLAPTTQPAIPVPTTQSATREALISSLIQLIRETVDPESWTSPKQIRELQGQLIILQTTQNQQAIATLLGQLREARGIQVLIEARFLTIDEKWLDTDGPLQRSLKGTSAGSPGIQNSSNDKQVDGLLRALMADAHATLLSAPRITLFSGQRAYVMVATQQAYVADLKPVAAADGRTVAYEPTVGTVNSGIVLDVQATASADRKSVTLTLRPQVSHLDRMDSIPFDKEKNLIIQRPVLSVDSMHTTVNIPDQQSVVFSGFTSRTVAGVMAATTMNAAGQAKPPLTATPATTTAAGVNGLDGFGPGRRVFLLVKPKVILATPGTQEAFPLLQSR